MTKDSDPQMRDLPMLDVDREQLREEFEGFDSMTLSEFQEAKRQRIDELLDLIGRLNN